jgi:hypothetical protein
VIVPDEPVTLPVGQPLRVQVDVASAADGTCGFRPSPTAAEPSRNAFLRDLPALLTDNELTGKWVVYHDAKRVAVAATQRDLIERSRKEGWNLDHCYVDMVIPHSSEPEVIEPPSAEAEEPRSKGTPGPRT